MGFWLLLIPATDDLVQRDYIYTHLCSERTFEDGVEGPPNPKIIYNYNMFSYFRETVHLCDNLSLSLWK